MCFLNKLFCLGEQTFQAYSTQVWEIETYSSTASLGVMVSKVSPASTPWFPVYVFSLWNQNHKQVVDLKYTLNSEDSVPSLPWAGTSGVSFTAIPSPSLYQPGSFWGMWYMVRSVDPMTVCTFLCLLCYKGGSLVWCEVIWDPMPGNQAFYNPPNSHCFCRRPCEQERQTYTYSMGWVQSCALLHMLSRIEGVQ